MRHKKRNCLGLPARLLAVLLPVLLAGCSLAPGGAAAARAEGAGQEQAGPAMESPAEKAKAPALSALPLRDKDTLYEQDDESSVVTMYLTVRRGNSAEGTDHAWSELNSYSVYDYEAMGVDRYQTEAILQVGDENGPLEGELGYGERTPNATVQVRGQTSSKYSQKNYKIRLKDGKGTWRQQQTIALNKHQQDGLRFRNKLGFDLLKGIPQIMSLRTQFVHLYVKDETGEGSGLFEDYGLYTQVEQLNKKALKAHGLDSSGDLYKVNECEFFTYEDIIKPTTDPSYDEKAFSVLLENKNNSDNTKLTALLKDINDYTLTADQLLEKHFNTENLAYWMAFQILTGNSDTQNRNFYLYSPTNLDIWYILPWDLDDALVKTERDLENYMNGVEWERGISNYWGNMLFRRCLESEEYRSRLDGAVMELREYLSREKLDSLVSRYLPVTMQYTFSYPDVLNAPVTPEEYGVITAALPGEIEENFAAYKESLQKPMPFYIGIPAEADGMLQLNWDVAYDFQAEDITYTAELSDTYDMSHILASYTGAWPEFKTDLLPEGQYFIRVQAGDSAGNRQYAFDYYVTENGKVYGTRCFYVLADGSIGEDSYAEN